MWIDRAVRWLLPREEHFFELLERGAECALRASELFAKCCESSDPQERTRHIAALTEVEHDADGVIHEVYEALSKTFVTPLDRGDIYALASSLEHITDAIHGTAGLITAHAMSDLPSGSAESAALILQATTAIRSSVKLLRTLSEAGVIRAACRRIKSLESEGDKVYARYISALFQNEKDAIRLLKHKEFLEGLDQILDVCNATATSLETTLIRNA